MTLALALLLGLFEPPQPGSYELPPIAQVQERELVDASGARVPFPGLAAGQVSVVGVIYRRCHEAQGCPASPALLSEVYPRLPRPSGRPVRGGPACLSF